MIKNIKVGSICEPTNRTDIILGMNMTFDDVLGIARPFVENIQRVREATLGSVISFQYDEGRNLHLLVCHQIGKGGWMDADKYVRYGMDYLWKADPFREYSIVSIGTGRVGRRDGADHAAIRTAMSTSFLPVDLFILDERAPIPAEMSAKILPFRMWDIERGEVPLRMAA